MARHLKFIVLFFLLAGLYACSGSGARLLTKASESETPNQSYRLIPTDYTLEVISPSSESLKLAYTKISESADNANETIARFRVDTANAPSPLVAKVKFGSKMPAVGNGEGVVLCSVGISGNKTIGLAGKASDGWLVVLFESGEYLLRKLASSEVSALNTFASYAYADAVSGEAPFTVNFSATSVNASGTVSYIWDFGDGGTSTEQSPSHTYTSAGNFVVTLVSRDSAGNTFFSFSTPITVASAGVGSISGTVTNSVSGSPLADITVTIVASDGELFSDITDANGFYEFTGLSSGEYSLLFAGTGFRSTTAVVELPGEALVVDKALEPTVNIFTSAPNFVFNPQPFTLNEENGIANINASIENYDGDTVIRILNGHATSIPFTLEPVTPIIGFFDDNIILTVGTNIVKYVVANEVGATISQEIVITWQPVGVEGVIFRATLTWDRGTPENRHDMDLHVVDPTGAECYFENPQIPSGSLDVDNVIGFGPENFTAVVPTNGSPVAGVYHIFVYYFGGTEPTNVTITLLLNPGTPQEEVAVIGPHLLPEWQATWYAADVTVDNAGFATYTTPGTPPPVVQ